MKEDLTLAGWIAEKAIEIGTYIEKIIENLSSNFPPIFVLFAILLIPLSVVGIIKLIKAIIDYL